MATKKRKRRGTSLAGIPTDSASLSKVGNVAAGALGGALLGSAIGRLGLLPGLALAAYGAINNKPAFIAGGATMAFAPEVKNAAVSTKAGVSGQVETAFNKIKAGAVSIGRKAYLDKVAPTVFADTAISGIEGVDYYDSAYANALNNIAGLAGGDYDDGMGRLAEASYQAAELGINGIEGIDGIDGVEEEEGIGAVSTVRTSDGW